MNSDTARRRTRRGSILAVLLLTLLALPAVAVAHIERASYWPNPAPDKSVKPAAGGKAPRARSLSSSLVAKLPGRTRVVCKSDSLKRLRTSVASARRKGYAIRPHDHRKFSKKQGKKLLKVNKALFKRCHYREIQKAVTASRNNDRVVILPGLYTEPTSRRQPTHDPKCQDLQIKNDRGQTAALSYAYQYTCPNDQNLIAVMGRKPGKGHDPEQPRMDRHGIPNSGPCVRCNLQIEGSGVKADDVTIDAGRTKSGDHGPIGAKKDVVIRGDRADGFVLRNVKTRHAAEHNIYVLESDGYLLDRFKSYYGGEYAVLTFVEDHGVIQNCEATGGGDSGLYPGAGAETGHQRNAGTKFRYNQVIRYCDSHHNASGYSGTASNAIHIHHNNFYDNALGFTTDVFTAAGHPGFPQDSDLIEHNNFYSNNFNVYAKNSGIEPTVPVPVGTGLWIAGGNDNNIRNNRFYDNWRRGTMLFAVPDSFVCGPQTGNSQAGCEAGKVSTSFNNKWNGNIMGVSPAGQTKPNGTDFWWDNWINNTGNCWWGNKAAPGRKITSVPGTLPNCNNGTAPQLSRGIGGPAQETELLACLAADESDTPEGGACPWFQQPPQPK